MTVRQILAISFFVCLGMIAVIHLDGGAAEKEDAAGVGRVFYVRQTVGNDANDGRSPETAWRSISILSETMRAGDTAYVGPGLYRDQIIVRNSGTAAKRIRFIADNRGELTGDPAGVVMITGADPVDEDIFAPHASPGVYKAPDFGRPVAGVVEMDGPQRRYVKATATAEYRREGLSELEIVQNLPSSYFYDRELGVFYIHTSDGRPPTEHEIEVIHRTGGISMTRQHFITVMGFTFRHMGDAGISFWRGSSNGIAIGNTSYGSRQGIRVYEAVNILVCDNTLFRNENCGVYFARQSNNGKAIGNILYENVKGVRWGSESASGMAADNIIFDNSEAGISIEGVAETIRLGGNKLVNNGSAQLQVIRSHLDSEGNCFENGNANQVIAYFLDPVNSTAFKTLADYQRARRLDLGSNEGDCGSLPVKVDVHKLHAETGAYADRVGGILDSQVSGGEERPPD